MCFNHINIFLTCLIFFLNTQLRVNIFYKISKDAIHTNKKIDDSKEIHISANKKANSWFCNSQM